MKTKLTTMLLAVAMLPALGHAQKEFGALAVNHHQPQLYGWAVNAYTKGEADSSALKECVNKGGSCRIVMRFHNDCAAYATGQTAGSTEYVAGWTWEQADWAAAEAEALGECIKRGGTPDTCVVRERNCTNQQIAAQSAPGFDCTKMNAATIERITNVQKEVCRTYFQQHKTYFDRRRKQLERYRNLCETTFLTLSVYASNISADRLCVRAVGKSGRLTDAEYACLQESSDLNTAATEQSMRQTRKTTLPGIGCGQNDFEVVDIFAHECNASPQSCRPFSAVN